MLHKVAQGQGLNLGELSTVKLDMIGIAQEPLLPIGQPTGQDNPDFPAAFLSQEVGGGCQDQRVFGPTKSPVLLDSGITIETIQIIGSKPTVDTCEAWAKIVDGCGRRLHVPLWGNGV